VKDADGRLFHARNDFVHRHSSEWRRRVARIARSITSDRPKKFFLDIPRIFRANILKFPA